MMRELLKSVESLLAEKRALADKEQQLIEHLNRVLPSMGYQVVAASSAPGARAARRSNSRGSAKGQGKPSSGAPKRLVCQQCGRRFAHPLHLGRHMSATHGRKKAA
jgi:hypothetical protein